MIGIARAIGGLIFRWRYRRAIRGFERMFGPYGNPPF